MDEVWTAEGGSEKLALRLFGPFEARVSGALLPPLRSRKGQWLLALLALRAGREVDRDWLAATLWSDSLEPQTLGNLRRTLTDLRAALGPEAARLSSSAPHLLRLDLSGADVDVVLFDAAITRGDVPSLETAVSLYRGPLLEGCVEEWAFSERQAREQAYLEALETLSVDALARGDPSAAERPLRRAIATDPLRESAQRALMQALVAGGQDAAALLVYRELRLLLRREMETEPDPETTALFDQIQSRTRTRRRTTDDRRPTTDDRGGHRREAVVLVLPPGGEGHPGQAEGPAATGPGSSVVGRRSSVVLLSRPDAQPDERVLKLLEATLVERGMTVFVDRPQTIDMEWARGVEPRLRAADAVLPLVSAAAVTSELFALEVQTAHEIDRQRGGPGLVPVYLHDPGPLPQPLAAILDPLPRLTWNGPHDDGRLVAEVLRVLERPAATTAVPLRDRLEPVGGAVPLDSAFYVVRPADHDFRAAIARGDSIVLVKGARQMGKTSLLARGLHQARKAGARVVRTDFQALNAAHLQSIDALFLRLAYAIADQLDLEIDPTENWHPHRGPSENLKRYWQRVALRATEAPVVWGLDEIDRLFTCDFGSEVFGLFRSWHNERALDPDGPWHRLTLAIAYATEHHLFITDVNQSPFNVGTRLTLEDFTRDQVADLNERYGAPLRGDAELDRYLRLVRGHPYLVRRGLHHMVVSGIDLGEIEARADRDEGIFGDHLRRMLVLLARDPDLCDVMRGILQGRPCPTEESFYRLRSAGVITGESAEEARPRCQLYATYLGRHLR